MFDGLGNEIFVGDVIYFEKPWTVTSNSSEKPKSYLGCVVHSLGISFDGIPQAWGKWTESIDPEHFRGCKTFKSQHMNSRDPTLRKLDNFKAYDPEQQPYTEDDI